MPDSAPSVEIWALDYLKQRYPILMVDRVLSHEISKKIRALKSITVNDIHFKGHFPGAPVFPGVLTIESFAQTAAILIRMEDGETPGVYDVIGSVLEFKFFRPLVPGDRLEIQMEITTAIGTNRIIAGKGFVGEEIVASGKFTFGKFKKT